MTQEEFYIWLLDCDPQINLNNFNPEFLKNYEIAKLFLEKFGIDHLDEKEQQKKLNLEAVSNWFKNSKYIRLEYNIPEISELLPERFKGYLDLQNSEIKSLPQLKSVELDLHLGRSKIQSLPKLEIVKGYLDLSRSKIQSLPQLKSVGRFLHLDNSQIQSLPQLESVGGDLYLRNSQIEFLPELESVGGKISVSEGRKYYWRNHFIKAGRIDLAVKVI